MAGLTARVEDEPTEVEDADDPFAGLSPEERTARMARLDRSWAQAQRGETRDAREILKELRARRGL